jgi:hypothetical protein
MCMGELMSDSVTWMLEVRRGVDKHGTDKGYYSPKLCLVS